MIHHMQSVYVFEVPTHIEVSHNVLWHVAIPLCVHACVSVSVCVCVCMCVCVCVCVCVYVCGGRGVATW